ncbi:hypothetical protein K435DRAFT_935353 [Dendrothele bispora CBS 962.96]|uniref:Uncharacterized protein n=1 Tax=Dendrothele bispora (strain CBS 962.96) TaxID=1314807 RepID=A0A4V4HGT8_DENBC|nr:hypothetical protein K435DRAFT_935353 [Dendrothele bispora CBS 962.96]
MSNFFQNTSHSSFQGSHITNTAIDYNIYIAAVDNITHNIGSQDQIVSNGARGESIFDQYHSFRRGDIRFLRKLSTKVIDEEKTPLWWDRNPTQKRLKYTRNAHSVSLFGVAAEEMRIPHQNVVHLYGLSKQKSNPALVFCDNPELLKSLVVIPLESGKLEVPKNPWKSTPEKEGIVFEHGWTRFDYDGTNWGKNFSCSVNLPHTLETKLLSAWLCQGMFVANAAGGDVSKLDQYGVATSMEISLVPDFVVQHPNIIPEKIYMFIAPVSFNQSLENGSTEMSWGEREEIHYFWSFDQKGIPLLQSVCDSIGLPKYKAETCSTMLFYCNFEFQAIQHLQEFFGYDPSTQDFTKACQLPLIEVIPLSEDPDKSHEKLENWHTVHDEVSSSDSESTHDDTGAQSRAIWFAMPGVRQEMNLTVSEILSYQDLDVSELDSCFEDWSDLGSETSKFDSPSDGTVHG